MAHETVLLRETVEALQLKSGMTIADATLGGGGHSEAILQQIMPGGTLVGIDKDAYAIETAGARLKAYRDSVRYVQDDFKNIKAILKGLDIQALDGAVMDLGVSSFQLDQCDRGFSYHQDAKLDMRMNQSEGASAADIVAGYSEKELARVIRDYGEERWAERIASFIVRERGERPIETTGQLVEVIKKAVPKGARRNGPHPARRTFQALRIEVNGELSALQTALADFVQALKNGGRLAIITFHSLEDRIVKNEFKRLADPCTCPKDFPVCVCGEISLGKVITRKPVLPGIEETERNSRARSAKLRVFEALK